MALPQTDSRERDEHPSAYRNAHGSVEAEPESVTVHLRHGAQVLAHRVLEATAASVLGYAWRRFVPSRNDLLNRRAGKLYQKLAEQEFGAVKVETADLPDEIVTRLVVPLKGQNIDREVDQALRRVMAIHDQVESAAPELVGRIVFDYASNGRPA